MTPPLTRRRALGLGAALAAGAATAGLSATASGLGAAIPVKASTGRPGSGLQPTGDPVSMAMHIHACFSEGTASMDAHLDQAEQTGVDVIWWTEHDFRVQAHGYRQGVQFEGMVEPEDGLDWIWTQNQTGEITGAAGTFVDAPHSPDEPGRALRLQATGPGEDWGWLRFEGAAWNSTYSTCLAGTTIELDVLTESLGADAELVVEIESSYRPERAGRPAGQYRLQYRVGSAVGWSTEDYGRLGVIGTRGSNTWQRLRMRPVDDIAALWPDLVAGDASLYRLRLAVRARRGAKASAVVDRLRFVRVRRVDQEALGVQLELMEAYASRYPGVRQHQAAELSLVRHLNAFGGKPFLPDYGDGPPYKDDTVEAAMAMTRLVHGRGGLASYNHPDVTNPPELGRELIETRNLGADLLEVGCGRKIDRTAFAYDIASRNAVFITATGVSDDHSGDSWLGQATRWITSAWSASTAAPELVDALGAGRCWFADPAAWRGAMDISAQGQPAMGGVLVTRDRLVPMEVMATDLPAGSTIEVITGRVDLAGTSTLSPANTVMQIPASEVTAGVVAFDLRLRRGRYVRAVVRDVAGTVIGFSNPTWLMPTLPPGGVPADRLL